MNRGLLHRRDAEEQFVLHGARGLALFAQQNAMAWVPALLRAPSRRRARGSWLGSALARPGAYFLAFLAAAFSFSAR